MRDLIEERETLYWLGEAGADDCMAKYMDQKTNRFKGEKGERFKNCVEAMKNCRKGKVQDPEGLCASIARKKGLA